MVGTPHARVVPRPLTAPEVATTLAEVDTGILAALVDGPAPTEDDLRAALAAHTADGSMYPLFFGCALDGQGIAELVEGIVRFVPAPTPERRGAAPRRFPGAPCSPYGPAQAANGGPMSGCTRAR